MFSITNKRGSAKSLLKEHCPGDAHVLVHKSGMFPKNNTSKLTANKKLTPVFYLHKLPDVDYAPLDPAALRLPAPQPPSERLLAAVEAFYSPPSHERPRNRSVYDTNFLQINK